MFIIERVQKLKTNLHIAKELETTPVLDKLLEYEGRLISNAHSEIFCRRSKVAMRAQCVLVATTLLHSGAKFHSFLYTGLILLLGMSHGFIILTLKKND